jgi:hypothetical protein
MLARRARAWIALSALGASAATASLGSGAPVPPCDAKPVPAYADDRASPQVEIWGDLEWRPPACVGWAPGKFRFVVALAGALDATTGDDILARLGAISSTKGLQYWSVTENGWRVLIEDATALSGPGAGAIARPDFSPAEMKDGAPHYFRERDNRSSRPIDYRMRVLQSLPGRVVAETSNVDPIKSFGVTLFPPGSLRTMYFAQRQPSGRWSLYLLSGASDDASRLVAVGKDSYVNRAMAAFRHVSGIMASPVPGSPAPR